KGIGKYIAAQDIVDYMATDEMKSRMKLKKGISLRTAQRWMKRMEYCWTKEPKGMYSDGYEREDIVNYRQNIFLPRWAEFKKRVAEELDEEWDDEELLERTFIVAPDGRTVVIWRHDECTFYMNDHRKIRWVHASGTAKPYSKGEGASMMVAAF
ncbi:hypothetical protein B0H19DRAFT_853293, partial [Mycena capillaripes]